MNPDQDRHPPDKTWVAAIHASDTDFAPLGAAVVIDEVRVLSCAHVVAGLWADGEPIWVAFPLGEEAAVDQRRLVVDVRLSSAPFDLAVLELAEPVPAGVTPAPLLCPKPSDLKDRHWWAFGFPWATKPVRFRAVRAGWRASLSYRTAARAAAMCTASTARNTGAVEETCRPKKPEAAEIGMTSPDSVPARANK